MRAMAACVLLFALWAEGCVTWPPEMAALQGRYDLISYGGDDLPVELPNGQLLKRGECSLDARRERFTLRLSLDFEERTPAEPILDYYTGTFTYDDEEGERGQMAGMFVTDARYPRSLWEGGYIVPDSIIEVPFSVSGGLLSVGTAGHDLVFEKRPPRR